MNILEQTEALKDLPDQALIKEMKMPTGMAPPVFITAELKRRQRIRDDFKRREAANTPTVAEEVVMAAGMPQGGIADAARALAPKTDMGQNTGVASMMPRTATRAPQPMAGGGIVRLQEGGDVEEVERYVVAIEGINDGRLMTLSADTLEQLQKVAPEVMANALVLDMETAKEGGMNITRLRPGDGFAVREVAERLSPERRGAITTDVATGTNLSSPAMVDQSPTAPSMLSSPPATPQLLEGGVASLASQGKQEQTVNMDPYLQTPSISTTAPDNPYKNFNPTFSQFNAPYMGIPVINMAPTQIDPRSGLERYEAELEADPDNIVASVARLGQAGQNAAEIANTLGRPIQEILDIGLGIAADGTVGVGALAADLIAVVQGAVVNNPESAEFYANIAKNLRKFGDDSYYAEGEILPRISNLRGEDPEKAAEEKRKQIQSDSLRAISDAMLANDQSLFAEGAPVEFLPEGQVYTVPRNVPVTSIEGTLGSPEVNPDNLATPNLTSLSGDAIKTMSGYGDGLSLSPEDQAQAELLDAKAQAKAATDAEKFAAGPPSQAELDKAMVRAFLADERTDEYGNQPGLAFELDPEDRAYRGVKEGRAFSLPFTRPNVPYERRPAIERLQDRTRSYYDDDQFVPPEQIYSYADPNAEGELIDRDKMQDEPLSFLDLLAESGGAIPPAPELVDTEYLDDYRRELIESEDGDPIISSITEGGIAATLGELTQAQRESLERFAGESSIDVAQAQTDAAAAKAKAEAEAKAAAAKAKAQAESIRPEEFSLRPKARPADLIPAAEPDVDTGGIASTSSDAINAAVKKSGGLSTDAWLAIAQGGAAMAASRSPTLIGALGEGIGAAAKGLQAQRKTEKAAALEQAKIDATLEAARMRNDRAGQPTVSQQLKILDDQIAALRGEQLMEGLTNIRKAEIDGLIASLQSQKNRIAAAAGIMLSPVGGASVSNIENLGQA